MKRVSIVCHQCLGNLWPWISLPKLRFKWLESTHGALIWNNCSWCPEFTYLPLTRAFCISLSSKNIDANRTVTNATDEAFNLHPRRRRKIASANGRWSGCDYIDPESVKHSWQFFDNGFIPIKHIILISKLTRYSSFSINQWHIFLFMETAFALIQKSQYLFMSSVVRWHTVTSLQLLLWKEKGLHLAYRITQTPPPSATDSKTIIMPEPRESTATCNMDGGSKHQRKCSATQTPKTPKWYGPSRGGTAYLTSTDDSIIIKYIKRIRQGRKGTWVNFWTDHLLSIR